jgi:regulator of sigma E protease
MTTILAGGLLLGVLVFVHELGHFLVAKACGVRVLVFSLGFGPRLFGFRRGDTDYRVSAVPLGGYVRMYGDDVGEEVPEEERHRSFLHKPTLQKSAIAFAGPAANFLLPVVLFFALFVGTETTSGTLVGTVVPGEPAAEAGLVPGDRLLEVEGRRVETFREVQKIVEARPGQKTRLLIERGGERLPLVLTPKSTPSLSPLERDKQLGRVGIMPHVQRPFLSVAPGSPAAAAGLKTLDLVTAVDATPVRSREHLLSLLDERAGAPLTLTVQVQPLAQEEGEPEERTIPLAPAPEEGALYHVEAEVSRDGVSDDELTDPKLMALAAKTRAALADEARASARRLGVSSYEGTLHVVEDDTPAGRLGVRRGDRVVTVHGEPVQVGSEVSTRLLGRPDDVHVVGVLDEQGRGRVLAFRLEPEKERGRQDFKTFGAFPGGGTWTDGELVTRQVSVVEATTRAVDETVGMVKMTLKSLWMLVTGQVGMSSLGGPITIVDLAGQAAERGHKSFVTLMAFISVNLAIVNLLPVPVLDGGHLLMFGIEAVSRQRLSTRTRERAVKLGFALLLCLIAVALVNDVLRLL